MAKKVIVSPITGQMETIDDAAPLNPQEAVNKARRELRELLNPSEGWFDDSHIIPKAVKPLTKFYLDAIDAQMEIWK